jgi:hypothetical protein
LPNIKLDIFDPDKIKYFQKKGIKISKNVSCPACGLNFDPKDLQ